MTTLEAEYTGPLRARQPFSSSCLGASMASRKSGEKRGPCGRLAPSLLRRAAGTGKIARYLRALAGAGAWPPAGSRLIAHTKGNRRPMAPRLLTFIRRGLVVGGG